LSDGQARQAALRDPLRSSGGQHEAGRFRRGIAEFLRLPLLITLGFAVVGVLVGVLDLSASGDSALRRVAEAVVPGDGASSFVSAAATSIVTVTSITFSVLLLAVQQTASALTPVVFDQFLRRTANQVYFGFFVGLSVFSFLILAMGRQDPAPVYGAALTLVLIVVAMVVLLLLIHGSIDQMRPQSVVRSIHELALRARERELVLLGHTRSERHSDPGTQERGVRVLDTGYVTTVDVDQLAQVAAKAGRDVEVLVDGTLGTYLMFGEVAARLVGVGADDDSWDEEVRTAFGMDDVRDVEAESGYAIDQLENIAWSSASSAQQSPQTAIIAVRTLRDLVARWLVAGERDRSDRSQRPRELPIVYVDGAVPNILDALTTVVVASAESRQVATCADALKGFGDIARRLQKGKDRDEFAEALDSCLPAVIQHAEVPKLKKSLRDLQGVLQEFDLDGSRVLQVRELLSEATRRLLPKASDEPEAAHPH
jgi:uncharacterized membrane protein